MMDHETIVMQRGGKALSRAVIRRLFDMNNVMLKIGRESALKIVPFWGKQSPLSASSMLILTDLLDESC